MKTLSESYTDALLKNGRTVSTLCSKGKRVKTPVVCFVNGKLYQNFKTIPAFFSKLFKMLHLRYVISSREIFNPMYALFTTSPGDRVTYMINSSSHCNSNHLCYFKFVGRVIAKAIYDNKLLECYFTRSFYKHILGKCVRYTDMESEDYSFYQVNEIIKFFLKSTPKKII